MLVMLMENLQYLQYPRKQAGTKVVQEKEAKYVCNVVLKNLQYPRKLTETKVVQEQEVSMLVMLYWEFFSTLKN